MESLLKTVQLNEDTTRALDEMRGGAVNPLFGATPDKADVHFSERIKPLLEDTGLPQVLVMQYGWFLREVARLWRKHAGRDLAFHLELCIRKWLSLGLETRTIQFLICEVHYSLKASLKGTDLTTRTRNYQAAGANRDAATESH